MNWLRTTQNPERFIMQKLWVVLKVSLTRPWVWMMLPMVLFQLIPLWKFAPLNPVTHYKNAIPAFDRPEVVVSNQFELYERAKQQRFADIEGLECRDLHAEISFDAQGVPNVNPAAIASGRIIDGGSWPLLDHTPQLKSLILQPPNSLNAEGWKRIGSLRHLEALQLEHIHVSTDDRANLQALMSDTLTSLTNLRQLNLNNVGGRYDWKLPPLPRVEFLVLGFNLQMEANLESLAQSSPYLQTLVLHTFDNFSYTDRMLESLGKMPQLQRLIICSSSKQDAWKESQRQVEFLRERLPRLNIERGVFSHNRVILHLFLSFVAAFLPFIAWFQSGLKLSQPMAAVMPGHRGPHLFWPLAISASCACLAGFLSIRTGTYWPAAVSITVMEVMLAATILPGHDLTGPWRKWIQYISMIDVICLLLGVTLALAAPYSADAYLMGDYPALAIGLMLWFLAAGAWKIWRATRLHRILAESGMPGIPGLNVGMHQAMNQPFAPAPGWSLAKWQLQRMQNAIDRKIAGMDRSNWAEMLRRASPSNPGMWVGLMMMAVFFVVFRMFKIPGTVPSKAAAAPIFAIGAFQAIFMFLMINVMLWVNRRGTIAHEFLRPVSRPLFWRHLRVAIFHDLKCAALFALGGGLWAAYLTNQNSLPILTVVHAVAATLGALAFLHGWVMLMVIGKRLWLHATLAVITMALVAGLSIASVAMTVGKDQNAIAAGACVFWVVVAGSAMQWGIARKLPDWELG